MLRVAGYGAASLLSCAAAMDALCTHLVAIFGSECLP